MLRPRLIARMDIKGPNLVKGIHLEGLRVVGNPIERAEHYYKQGADEILYMDIVASLYGRNSLLDLVKQTVKKVNIPVTVGGGMRSVDDVWAALRAGADKVAINTAAVQRPELLNEIAQRFGSQCVVSSIEYMKTIEGNLEIFTDNGREKTGINLFDWVKEVQAQHVGEILLTSIEHEGIGKGCDLEMIQKIQSMVQVPVIASGGIGSQDHLLEVYQSTGCNAVAIAGEIHYQRMDLFKAKDFLVEHGIPMRLWQAS